MASITQTIPSYTAGMSQQPDSLKAPGQVNSAKNVLPDVTRGLMKRPGGTLIESLSHNADTALNSQTDGKWFSYYRDEAEQYIGQISRTGDVNMWSCLDGSTKNVVVADPNCTTYLTHTSDEDIQTLTLNDSTYLSNRKITTAMSSTTEPARPYEAFVELKQIKYSTQYALNVYNNTTTQVVDTATRLDVTYTQANANTPDDLENNGTCDSVGIQIFSVNYNDASSFISLQDSTGAAITTRGTNLYFRITTTGQPTTIGGSSPTYYCRYQVKLDLLYGGEGWQTGDVIKVRMYNASAASDYTVTVADHSPSTVKANLALVRPNPTPFDKDTAVTADSILGDIYSGIVANPGFTVSQIGTGLYITRTDAAFNMATPAPELMTVLTDSIQNVDDLPRQCKHGYVVRVKNSESNQDDYYVKFIGFNNKDGPGTWEECAQPGRKIEFDTATMPLTLIRTADGNFRLSELDGSSYNITISGVTTSYTVDAWEDCLVGDPVTAEEPSFIGYGINKMLFFRNRLVFLSQENVIMSQPGGFFNFWPKSAMTFSATDHIDLSCSSEFPAVVYDGIQTNAGLVLFTKNQQFMLTTDSDVLSPETAKINSLSSYNFNYQTNPISLGTTIGFLDNAGRYSRFMEMARIAREGEPEVLDQSKVVERLFEKDLRLVSNSRENNLIFFSEKNVPNMYGYRYFRVGEKMIQQAWFEWELSGNIQYHCVLDDAVYAVVRGDGNLDVLQRFDIKIDEATRTITDDKDTADTTDDVTYRIHLDNSAIISSGSLTYDVATKKTYFSKPNSFNHSTKQLAVYCHIQGDNEGRYGLAEVNGSNIEFDGDWTGQNIIAGYLYDMEVEFPTIYNQSQNGERWKSDTQGSLIVHRLKLRFGAAGSYKTTLKRIGKDDYTETYESTILNAYGANRVGIIEDAQQTVPVYERNTNLTVQLKSTNPTPAILHSMTWEGEYTSRFYQRA